jgi:hypothetical protein
MQKGFKPLIRDLGLIDEKKIKGRKSRNTVPLSRVVVQIFVAETNKVFLFLFFY